MAKNTKNTNTSKNTGNTSTTRDTGEGGEHRRISDPDELARLSPDEVIERVRPLFGKGKLVERDERFVRLRPDIPGVCAELADRWRDEPRLDGSEVPFGEYLAARLRTTLLALDQKQQPELYDAHRRYRPKRAPLPLDRDPPSEEPASEEPAQETPASAAGTPDPFSQCWPLVADDEREARSLQERLSRTMGVPRQGFETDQAVSRLASFVSVTGSGSFR